VSAFHDLAVFPLAGSDQAVALWRDEQLAELWPEAPPRERLELSLSGGPDLLATARRLASGACPWPLARAILA
jgi:hypothetical protein